MWDLTPAFVALILGTLVALVFLEGLLSADNALVLAVMVRHLPKQEQKRALRYGIWGAFVFRAIAVLLSTALMNYWHFKVIGGVYLLYLAVSHFVFSNHDSDQVKSSRFGRGFWGTVISVELADIAFSIDSILAAVAMVPQEFSGWLKLGIVYTGGILGIITMRYVAGYFIILLERFEGLAAGAYFLVGWIGLKLVISGVHNGHFLAGELPDWLFWAVMVLIVIASMLIKPAKKKPHPILEEVGMGSVKIEDGASES